jgi:hypothetical protein
MGRMATIVAVSGCAPAVGASTLARGLHDVFSRDQRVDLVEEDEVLTRPVFAPMARELAVTGACGTATLAGCVTDFIRDSAASEHDVVVCDSLFPFVRSLSDWDNGEIAIDGFLAECSEAIGLTPFTLVYLDADIHAALRNAAEREPAGWLEWYVTNLVRNETAGTASQLDLAVGVLEHEREVALSLMAKHGWDVRRIPETHLLNIVEVLERAERHLEVAGVAQKYSSR